MPWVMSYKSKVWLKTVLHVDNRKVVYIVLVDICCWHICAFTATFPGDWDQWAVSWTNPQYHYKLECCCQCQEWSWWATSAYMVKYTRSLKVWMNKGEWISTRNLGDISLIIAYFNLGMAYSIGKTLGKMVF